MRRAIAVSLHDVEPATFVRVALLRDWLDDLGIDRATLLVVPARDLHPLGDRSPELCDWLAERRSAGDTIAQHGFHHTPGLLRAGATGAPGGRGTPTGGGGGSGEFAHLDEGQARRALLAGRRILRLAGIEPRGFVAAGFAYPPPLLRALRPTFDWWATEHRLHHDQGRSVRLAPSLSFGAGPRPRLDALIGAVAHGPLVRIELHPDVLDDPADVGRLERLLRAARRCRPVTCDELLVA